MTTDADDIVRLMYVLVAERKKRRWEIAREIIDWIERREREITDIETGAAHLLIQVAEQIGQRSRE